MNFNIENSLIFKIALGIVIIAVGVFIGRIIAILLKKFFQRSEVDKAMPKSFVDLFITVVNWSIVLLFINFALIQLSIPRLTDWITPILTLIPSLVGGLILIGIGFVIALYLKDIIEESKIKECDILSKIIFYFVLYVFMIFAFETVMINQDKQMVNQLIIIISAIAAAGIAFRYSKGKH